VKMKEPTSKIPSSDLAEPLVRAGSALARLQQGLMAGTLIFTVCWLVYWWSRSPAVALLGVMLSMGGYAFVLALEGLAAAWLNRLDEAPRAGWRDLLGAWWQEVRVAPQVFAWRQPFRWASLPDSDEPSGSGTPAVVFIHGFVCNRGLWLPWMKRLRDQGVPYVSVNLEPVFGSIDDYAQLISESVRRAQALTGAPPMLVCHSMGGLAARVWLASEPETPVHRVVTIGSPHRGTWLGRFSRAATGCSSCRSVKHKSTPTTRTRALSAGTRTPTTSCSRRPPPHCPAPTTGCSPARPTWPWRFTPG
jgi:triacylglycerol lipase